MIERSVRSHLVDTFLEGAKQLLLLDSAPSEHAASARWDKTTKGVGRFG